MDKVSPFLFAAAAIVMPAEARVLDQSHAHIMEASGRFGIPESWIRAVVLAESGGDAHAISPKGAMGLMQLMPGTWEEMRAAHDLGADPFDPRANILAGTAYLKAMRDRFGYPALFAAYQAGPGRYEDHLRAGNPLPAETRTYVAKVEKALAGMADVALDGAIPPSSDTRIASGTRLFFPLATIKGEAGNTENSAPTNGLFVPLSPRKPDER